ncbi:lipid scramblase CLPTM1L [Diabrotica virgifera virgifera]|uniref:Lipid scramblase CLPTM1L n=1 Tax=Diabrotica virgifera virgifera TaxID=50390 RepID=A0ABM5JXC9_DIAVI|nr:lipid scramblase CLPTM1L [Diabrotica virgifera virgifera]
MRPSLGSVLTVLFFIFILKSMYSLFGIFQLPVCEKGDVCYKSYLNSNPKLDLVVFLSDNSKSGNFDKILHLKEFDYFSPLEKQLTLEISKPARNNGSLIIHSVLVPSQRIHTDDLKELIDAPDSTYIKSRLTKYSIPISASFNLLKENGKTLTWKPVTHLRSRYAVIMCTDEVTVPHSAIPMEIIRDFRVNRQRKFLPIFHTDVLNMRTRDLVEITPETTSLNFTYIYTPTSFGKMRFILQIEITLKQFLNLGFTEKDLDEVKGVFADTNLHLLCATLFIGSVHLLLDFLTFKNDVSFWKSQTSMAGLSTRAVLWRAFSQTIVFLFLLDEGTSLLVLIPSGIGTLIEFWKVSKVFKTTISWRGLKLNKAQTETDEEKKTREYDEECMRYLSYLLYPLCISAAVYSLIYQPHKSWYSWTINSLVNGVYAFGFIFMLPQLFINYRLKSVAALPWRAFTYRAFNTFIDDIFAFIITMPMAHRVACFRDDVVFLIYLYQRWLYPVDKSRTDDMSHVVGEQKKGNDKKEKKEN